MVQTQEQLAFFDPSPDRIYTHFPSPPSDDEINAWLDGKGPRTWVNGPDVCPLLDIILSPSNMGPYNLLRTATFEAMQRYNHSPRGQRFGVYGRSGGGKTYIIRKYAETLGIPFILIQSDSLDSTWTLFEMIRAEFEKRGTPIVPDGGPNEYTLPPCIIAFDEAHALPRKLMKGGGLLCPMEHSDGILKTRKGKNTPIITVDCHNCGWAAMTTDKGLLFDALKTRLETEIDWAPAGPNEIQKIVYLQLNKEYQAGELRLPFTQIASQIVAKYELVPRLALAFGRQMIRQANMAGGTWLQAAQIAAQNLRKLSCGFTEKQLKILEALGQRTISKQTLTTVAGCRRLEELENDILPGLQEYGNGGPYVVSLGGRGCVITKAGIRKLDELGIPNNGERITAEYLEEKAA